MKWLKENWHKVAEMFIAIVGTVGVARYWTDFISMCERYPLQAFSVAVLAFAAGAAAGWAVCAKAKMHELESELAEKQAKIDRLMNRRELARIEFRGLSYSELKIAKQIALAKNPPFLSISDPSVVGLFKSGLATIADDSTYAPPDSFPIKLKEAFRSRAVEFMDVLDEVMNEIDEKSRKQ